MPRKTRVLVADEDGIMRDGLCALLQSDDGLEVVAATAIRGDALQTLTTAQPDIIIIDFAADLKSGPETIAQVRRRWPDVRVLVLTVRRDETFIETALRAGADGYVLKTDSRTELFNATNSVNFAGPQTSITSSAFGTISLTQVNNPRALQFGLRVLF